MSMTIAEDSTAVESETPLESLIDCDVHNTPRTAEDVRKHVPERWRKRFDRPPHLANHGGLVLGARPQRHIFRLDAMPETGAPGSDLSLMQDQLLDRYNVDKVLLLPLDGAPFPQYGEVGRVFSAALNDWNDEEWLSRDKRLYGGMSIPIEDATQAVLEIERSAQNPRFVGVLIPMHTREGLGHPKYWPIYEAAVAQGLPIVAHIGYFAGVMTPVGPPTYFLEHHVTYSLPYQAQIASLVYSGVFERFPDLQFVMEEGGVAWLAPLMWRLDRTWEAMRDQEPHLTRAPSEVIKSHFSFTTQPMDEPERPAYLPEMLEHLDLGDRLLFSSDYPHWDFDDPTRVLDSFRIGEQLRRNIVHDNAQRLFGFPA